MTLRTGRPRLGTALGICLLAATMLVVAPTKEAEAAAPVTVEGVACSLGQDVGALATTTVSHEMRRAGADPAAHAIRYYFTDAVADADSFTVGVIGADYIDQAVVKSSGTQTFAGTEYSYTYDVSIIGALPAGLATNSVDVATGILYDVSPLAQSYQTRYHLGFRDGAPAVFTVNNSAALGSARIYAYPDAVPTSASFGDDPSTLIDVTADFTLTQSSAGVAQYSSTTTPYRRFLLVIDHAAANASESVTAGTTNSTSVTTYMSTAYTEAFASAIAAQSSIPCPEYPALTVKKLDAETGSPLAGATFTLTGQGPITSALPAVTLTSGEDGTAATAQLHKGIYLLEETGAPLGYVKSATPTYIRVNADGTIETAADPAGEWSPVSELTLSVENTPEPEEPPVDEPESPGPETPEPGAPAPQVPSAQTLSRRTGRTAGARIVKILAPAVVLRTRAPSRRPLSQGRRLRPRR